MKNESPNKATNEIKKKPFELVGGHPALDLVNTLDWRFRDGQPEELITDFADVIRFVVQCESITGAEGRCLLRSTGTNKAVHLLAKTRELREAAAQVLYASVDHSGPPLEAVRALEGCFKDAEAHLKLSWSENRLQWAFPAVSPAPELPLWILSLKVAQLTTSGDMGLVRACSDPHCRWLFLDTSKNHSRRWCDMKICGNRMKARRFKAQHP